MWYKNGKLWAAIITVLVGILGAVAGSDVKKLVCEPESVVDVQN